MKISMPIIQFTDLDELLDELRPDKNALYPGHIIRVAALDVTRNVNHKLGLRLAGLGVHVRAIADNHTILACYVPVRNVELIHGRALDARDDVYHQAWTAAEALRERIADYLRQLGYNVRPGILDIGDVRPIQGSWNPPSLADDQEETAPIKESR